MSKIRLRQRLAPFKLSIGVATACSILLGLITALLGFAFGPSLQVLFQPAETLSIVDLMGPRIGDWAIKLGATPMITTSSLFSSLPWVVAILAALRAAMTIYVFFSWERISELAARSLREDLMRSFLKLPYAHFATLDHDQVEKVNLSALIANDIGQIRQYIVRFYGSIPREVLQSLFLVGTMLLLSPALFLIFLILILPSVYFVGRLSRKLKRRSKTALNVFSDLTDWIEQRLLGIETIKHYRSEASEIRGMHQMADRLEEKFFAAARTRSISTPALETAAIICFGLILYLAARLIEWELATASVQMSFFACLALLAQAAGKLARYVNIRAESLASMERLETQWQQIDHLSEHRSNDTKVIKTKRVKHRDHKAIVCSDVSVIYPEAKEPALNQLSVSFYYGELVALEGPSGSGKSTLCKAILELTPLTNGSIELMLDDPNQALPISFMPQTPIAIPDCIARNVSYPDFHFDRSKVLSALEQAQILDTLVAKGWDLDTEIGVGLTELSGGELQRLSLARIFYHQSPIVIVDECTSALDENTERLILDSLKLLARRGRCVIMIAHRPAAVQAADRVVSLREPV